jgi:hypothetical protein
MMRSTFASIFTLLVVIATVFTSCRKDDFDNPPAGGTDPNLVANTTIAQLKQGYVFGQYDTIKTDVIISGIVTADDKSGNFYKTIVIQDATAAIAIRLDVSDYYTRYPIGRRIFVKCKNLIIGDYNNLIQLGGFIDNSVPSQPSVEPIPYTLVDKFIFPGQYNLAVSPTVVTIPDLLANPLQYQNMLVRLNQVEFASSDTGLTYADVVLQQSANRKLKDCSNNTIELRTSNYATFAGQNLPNGNGSITTIFSVFGSSPQMYIRDLNDVKLDTARCGSGPGSNITIATCRSYFTGTTTTAPAGKKIKGIVISDVSNLNTDPRNLAIQDSTAGIVVRFTSSHSFPLGAEVEVDISSQELSEFAGLLQVNNVPNGNAIQTGTGTVTPQVVTIAQINANFEAWESTLVKVNLATITGTGSTYSGSRTLTDASGTMTLYTRSQATFASQNYPLGVVSVTGILVPFNSTKQISIRSTADVQ